MIILNYVVKVLYPVLKGFTSESCKLAALTGGFLHF